MKNKRNKTKASKPAKNVDEYLSNLPDDIKKVFEKLRYAIKSAAPEAEEIISYQIPTYKYHGPLVHFTVRKDYCSLIVVSKLVLDKFKNELKDYNISGTTIHFTKEHPLPSTLIKKIIKERVKENEALKK
jgi:uncharacterized protein YdhG (YjbR/CyaY superfamily)